ncbi:hypothetical protein HK096_010161 [Nowakowskiella sp. JEL0078]|nr:hypothetical protein HK096_010161 [Nowakowskiella sp. JEL0078]
MEVQQNTTLDFINKAYFEDTKYDYEDFLRRCFIPEVFFRLAKECGLSGAKVYMAREKQITNILTFQNHLLNGTAPEYIKIEVHGTPKDLDISETIKLAEKKLVKKLEQFHITKFNTLNDKLSNLVKELLLNIQDLAIRSTINPVDAATISSYIEVNPIVALAEQSFHTNVTLFQIKAKEDKEKKIKALEKFKKSSEIVQNSTGSTESEEDKLNDLMAKVQFLDNQIKKLNKQFDDKENLKNLNKKKNKNGKKSVKQKD